MKQTTKFQELLQVAKSYEDVAGGFYVEGFESVEAYVEMRNEYEDYAIWDFYYQTGVSTPKHSRTETPIIVTAYENNKYVSVIYVTESEYCNEAAIKMYMKHEVDLFEERVGGTI